MRYPSMGLLLRPTCNRASSMLPALARMLLVSAGLLTLPGCVRWKDASGTRHMLVVGLGVVSTQDSKPEAARVTRAHVVGVAADREGVMAGMSERFITSVPANAEDVRIEASHRPFAPIRVEVQKAQPQP